jgi:thioredoxin 1
MCAILAACGSVAGDDSQAVNKSTPTGPTPIVIASNPSTSGTKAATPDTSKLCGRSATEVEAALGRPQGKLQTAQGALWFYSAWKVQFDKQGQVLTVKEDKPVRLAKVDPRFIAAADAADKAAAERATADAAEKARAAALTEDVRVISNGGQEVDLASLVTQGKITILDFYADWCVPCKKISPVLEQLATDDPDVVLLKVNIVSFKSPVTQQFGIESVPNVRVFDRSRTQIGEATHDVDLVMALVKQAKGT